MNHDVPPGARHAPPVFRTCLECGGDGIEDLTAAYRGNNYPGPHRTRRCATCRGEGVIRMEPDG